MPVQPILVANDISVYKAEVHDEGFLVWSRVVRPYQFAHAALLHSHSVLTFVVEAHFAGFAAEAVLCRVPCQEHHMLGGRTWNTQGKKEKTVHVHVRSWTSIHSGPNCNLLQQKGMEEMENIIQNYIACGTI